MGDVPRGARHWLLQVASTISPAKESRAGPASPRARPALQAVQGPIQRLVIPLPGVDLIVTYVGKAVDDVGAQQGVHSVWEAAPVALPVLGPAGVVADQLVCCT